MVPLPLVYLASFFTGLVTLAITAPLGGALVRYRAHYNPKRIHLGEEGQPAESPITGYFSVLRRVYRLEGWSGLYKGFSPSFIAFVFIFSILLSYLSLDASVLPQLMWSVNYLPVIGKVLYGFLATLIGMPMAILTNRAIVTPYRLPYTNPMTAVRVLLSPTERRKPWKLFLLPGLFSAMFLQTFIALFVVPTVRILLIPFTSKFNPFLALVSFGYLFFILIVAAVQGPLNVVSTRLAIQRYDSAESASEDAEAYGVELYSNEEVISLKDDQDPYLGLQDCLNRIIAEEGWRTLFRAWWMTVIAAFVL